MSSRKNHRAQKYSVDKNNLMREKEGVEESTKTPQKLIHNVPSGWSSACLPRRYQSSAAWLQARRDDRMTAQLMTAGLLALPSNRPDSRRRMSKP